MEMMHDDKSLSGVTSNETRDQLITFISSLCPEVLITTLICFHCVADELSKLGGITGETAHCMIGLRESFTSRVYLDELHRIADLIQVDLRRSEMQ